MLDGKSLLRWDPATLCNEKCPIYDDCPYVKEGRCSLERTYMNGIYNTLISPHPNQGIADMLSDIELQRVGIHLIPLYHQLIRLKKEAFAVKQMTVTNKQGSVNIHPVFKEIREVIRCISKEIKEIGINEKWKRKYGGVVNIEGGSGSIEELMEQGDPNFYDHLSKVDEQDDAAVAAVPADKPKQKKPDKPKKPKTGRRSGRPSKYAMGEA